jgi:hypothetical protein
VRAAPCCLQLTPAVMRTKGGLLLNDLTTLQQKFDGPSVRVLVTIVDTYGRPLAFSRRRSSRKVLGKQPPGWIKSSPQSINDPTRRDAWVLSKGRTTVIAVPHEWGVELVIPIVAGIAVEGIVALTKWAWSRWHRQGRGRDNETTSIRVQVVTARDRQGRPRVMRTLEVSGAISGAELRRVLKDASTSSRRSRPRRLISA